MSKLFIFLLIIFSLSFDIDASNDEHIYLQAQKEYESGQINEALWSKAMTLSSGDKEKAKYKYISLRVEKLILENTNVKNQNSFEEIKSSSKKLDVDKEIDQKNKISDIKLLHIPEEELNNPIKFEDLSKDEQEAIGKVFRETLDNCLNNQDRNLLIEAYKNNGFTEQQAKNTVCADMLGGVKNIHNDNQVSEEIIFLASLMFNRGLVDSPLLYTLDKNNKFTTTNIKSRFYLDKTSLVKTSVDCGKSLERRKIENQEYRQFYFIKDNDSSHLTPELSKTVEDLLWSGAKQVGSFNPKDTGVKETMSSANLIQFSCKKQNKFRYLSRAFYSEEFLKGDLNTIHPVHGLRKNNSLSYALMTFPPFFLPIPGNKGLNFYKALNEFVCKLPDEEFVDNTNQNNEKTCSNPKTFEYLRN